nr:protein adenylyltransferase SelO family protein [Corynebacterium mendelii]
MCTPWSPDCQPPLPAGGQPRLVVFNRQLAAELGFDPDWLSSAGGIDFLMGRQPPAGAEPVAQAYAGHQFGNFVPLLGDGRAVLLGEIETPAGQVIDLHLKGSGRTAFSRGGDGLAPLAAMLREYIISEAMHGLGIPTSRSLAVIDPGWQVVRNTPQRAGLLVRTAPSHLRVGSFQYAAARQLADPGSTLTRRLAEFAIERHFSDLLPGNQSAAATDSTSSTAATGGHPDTYRRFIEAVCDRQAGLVASWMGIGFVHGVLNTDNVTVGGFTIDYGPCAFLDNHDPAAVFSSIDTAGRYRFDQQPAVMQWNMARFIDSVLPLVFDGRPTIGGPAHSFAMEQRARFGNRILDCHDRLLHRKLGLAAVPPTDPDHTRNKQLVHDFLRLLATHHPDHTRAFDLLTQAAHSRRGTGRSPATAPGDGGNRATDTIHRAVAEVFCGAGAGTSAAAPLLGWLHRWLRTDPDPEVMSRTNPVHIPRNHVVDRAIAEAVDGEMALFNETLAAVTAPFDRRCRHDSTRMPPPAGSPACTTFCGT